MPNEQAHLPIDFIFPLPQKCYNKLMIYFVIIFVLGIILGMAFAYYFHMHKKAEKNNVVTEKLAGIYSVLQERISQKQSRKLKIIELLQKKKELSNSEIKKIIGVSRRSVINYLDELEEEGKVEQIGDVGRSVVYRLKKD